ncbi:MAG TPA: arginine repressor [Candidatus Limosilactobacillus faecipullorum]|nr:arginine repressor [Candidatus Limosilactobacillus faecipullorum]
MGNRDRRKLIKQLIADFKISTQEELLQRLKDAGEEATQATISRDLHSLNVAKVNDENGHSYYIQVENAASKINQRMYEMIRNTVESITTVQFINVIKTTPNSNYATILAGLFDDSQMPEVTGTLAGNDTFITISRTPEEAKKINQLVQKYMEH